MTREEAMQQLVRTTDFVFENGKVAVRSVRLIDRIEGIERRGWAMPGHHVPVASSHASTASRAA